MAKRKPIDFTHCQICGVGIHWTPRATRQHRGPLDPGQVVYLDLDGEPITIAYEPRSGYEIRGAVVHDLSAPEQRKADACDRPAAGDGVRRIVRCYRLHCCDPRDVEARRAGAPAPVHGGADRTAGGHLE